MEPEAHRARHAGKGLRSGAPFHPQCPTAGRSTSTASPLPTLCPPPANPHSPASVLRHARRGIVARKVRSFPARCSVAARCEGGQPSHLPPRRPDAPSDEPATGSPAPPAGERSAAPHHRPIRTEPTTPTRPGVQLPRIQIAGRPTAGTLLTTSPRGSEASTADRDAGCCRPGS
jgi:hypothetical protein